MTRRYYFHKILSIHRDEIINKRTWARIYSTIYLFNTEKTISLPKFEKIFRKFYNFSLKYSLSFLCNNLFDIKDNKIIPMIDCKDYYPATSQNFEKLGDLL